MLSVNNVEKYCPTG